MRRRRAGIGATLGAIAVGLVAITTAPSAGAMSSPTASTAPPAPRPGVYHGQTSQGLAITLRVAHSRRALTSLTVRFQLRCTRHRAPQYIVSPVLARYPWQLNASRGLGFTRVFHDTTGERYRLTGTFGRAAATGTLRSTWSSPRYGSCTTGRVRWRARLR